MLHWSKRKTIAAHWSASGEYWMNDAEKQTKSYWTPSGLWTHTPWQATNIAPLRGLYINGGCLKMHIISRDLIFPEKWALPLKASIRRDNKMIEILNVNESTPRRVDNLVEQSKCKSNQNPEGVIWFPIGHSYPSVFTAVTGVPPISRCRISYLSLWIAKWTTGQLLGEGKYLLAVRIISFNLIGYAFYFTEHRFKKIWIKY